MGNISSLIENNSFFNFFIKIGLKYYCQCLYDASTASLNLKYKPTKLVPQNHDDICRASYRTRFRAELFVLLTTTWSVSADQKTATGARAVGVVALKSGTTYLTLYDLATLLHHVKRTWKLICSIRHLPPYSPPIHCNPSLNAGLDSRACNVDINLTKLKFCIWEG